MSVVVTGVTTDAVVLWVGEFVGFVVLVGAFLFIKFNGRSAIDIVKAALDARSARIDVQLRIAEESRVEAEKAHEDARAEIAKAHEEAATIISRAEAMLSSLHEEIVAEADREKQRIVEQAREEIEAERNRAIVTLRTRAADVAVDAAHEVLRRSMDEQTDHAIIVRALAGDAPNGDGAKP
jgi:F-type H+-transporting ATPase subunit b